MNSGPRNDDNNRQPGRADHEHLAQVATMIDGVHVPDEYADLAKYQRATPEYGLRSHALAIEHFTHLLNTENPTNAG